MARRLVFACCALGLFLAGSAPAETDDGAQSEPDDFKRSGFYLGAGFTWAFHWMPDLDDDLAVTIRTSGSPGFNVLGGYRAFSWLGAEIEYEYIDGFENKVSGMTAFRLRYHVVTANAKFILPVLDRFQPYFLLGVGFSVGDVSDRAGVGLGLDGSEIGFAGRVHLGLDTYITKHFLFNVSVGGVFPTLTIPNSAGTDIDQLFYIPIQGGFQYRF